MATPAHPLQSTWVLWEHKSISKTDDWSQSMKAVCEFSTVEEFWKYWSFVPRPSEVLFDGHSRKGRCNLHINEYLVRLVDVIFPYSNIIISHRMSITEVEGRSIEAFSIFKKGIRPEWEDTANRTGGELTCRKSFQPEQLDVFWENLVLALIGETIDEGDEICGCRVVDKSAAKGKGPSRCMYKLELWLRTGNAEVADKLRVRMLDALTDGEASKPNSRVKLPEFEYKRRAP